MKFKILSKNELPQWDKFVDASPQGSIFAKSFYLDALRRFYKIGVLTKNKVIQGGIVLIKNEIKVYSNPLFAKYLGVLLGPIEGKYVNRIEVEKKLTETIIQNIKWCKLFDYTFHPSFQNWLPFYWAGYRQETKYTYRLNDLSNLDQIKYEMNTAVRNDIKKAVKNNIHIDYNVSLDRFFYINRLTYQRQGGDIPYTISFFKYFYNVLKEKNAIKLLAAIDDRNEYHAVSCIVYDSKYSYLIINGMNHNLQNFGANSFLILKTIEFASKVSKGFDFEGSMIKSIERFYRGFGGELTPYYQIWKNNMINNGKHRLIKIYKKIKFGK